MDKYVVLSVNDNPDYLHYAPLTVWCWAQFGYKTKLFYLGKNNDREKFVLNFCEEMGAEIFIVNPIEGYRDDTVIQCARLMCGYHAKQDDILMTGDIDMIPLSDYWHNDNLLRVYGWDLTGRGHIPICYISAPAMAWLLLIKEVNLKQLLDKYPQAKDPDFYKYWFTDQDIITERINKTGFSSMDRGQYPNGYAYGRVDRGDWKLDHPEYIDAHLPRQAWLNETAMNQVLGLLQKCHPKAVGWFKLYTEDFQRAWKDE